MRKMSVVLLSGGLDSTTVAAHAKAQGYELVALTFNYGQRHQREMEAAKRVARMLEIRQEVADLPALKSLSWYSALTEYQDRLFSAGRSTISCRISSIRATRLAASVSL